MFSPFDQEEVEEPLLFNIPRGTKPSQVTDTYFWLIANNSRTIKRPTERTGKWLIFKSWDDLDNLWERVKKATYSGDLGPSSKVATKTPNPLSKDPDTGVICVYTYDYEDKKDVRRVRRKLLSIGITELLYYKPDEATRDGVYGSTGWLFSSEDDGLYTNGNYYK